MKLLKLLINWFMKLVSKKRKGEVVTKVVKNEKPKVVKVEKPQVKTRNVSPPKKKVGWEKVKTRNSYGSGIASIGQNKKFKGWQRENRRFRKAS